jgi:hypothetical protein
MMLRADVVAGDMHGRDNTTHRNAPGKAWFIFLESKAHIATFEVNERACCVAYLYKPFKRSIQSSRGRGSCDIPHINTSAVYVQPVYILSRKYPVRAVPGKFP